MSGEKDIHKDIKRYTEDSLRIYRYPIPQGTQKIVIQCKYCIKYIFYGCLANMQPNIQKYAVLIAV